MNQLSAEVEFARPLTDTILQFIIKPERYIAYEAGQYLKIITKQETYSYSIANAPLGSHRYELHIRHGRENATNQSLLATMQRQGKILIELPFGSCAIPCLNPSKPILFIAAGTGFAPINAMIEQLFADGVSCSIKLFWSVFDTSDLYMHEKILQWQAHTHHFDYVPFLSKFSQRSLESFIFEQHKDDLNQYQIVMNGPFDLMYTLRKALLLGGVKSDNLFSDAW